MLASKRMLSFASTLPKQSLVPAIQNGVAAISQTRGFVSKKEMVNQEYQEPMARVIGRTPKICSPEDAMGFLESGQTVFIQGGCATPAVLVDAMVKNAKANSLKDIRTVHIHTEGRTPYATPEYQDHFRPLSLFIAGKDMRDAVASGRAEFIPCFLSQVPRLFHERIIDLDVAFVHVSPPDEHGFCSLGTSVDCARQAIKSAKVIIGQMNRHMPRTFGDGIIHVSHFDALVPVDFPIFEHPAHPPSEVEAKIGKLIAENLVDDGACLQMGIGAIPDAALAAMKHHKDLGIHTELFSDGIIDLYENGIITNSRKEIHTGKIIGGFVMGSQRLYKFIDNNPDVHLLDISYVNNVNTISKLSKMTAINSAIEIDLTGQVNASSLGVRMYSGVGGQVDYIHGASLSPGGKPIIAMASTTNKGVSKIVPYLQHGSTVTTTQNHVHYVVTEYGIASLFGKSLQQRALSLIDIAHPDHREALEKAAYERLRLHKGER